MKPARVLLIEDDASIQRFVELALEDEPVTLHPAPTVADRVKASGTLRVCIWPDYYGITWRNPRTQQLGGIDVDLSAEFGRDMKAKIEYVEAIITDHYCQTR